MRGWFYVAKDKEIEFIFPCSRNGKNIPSEEFTMQTHPFLLHSLLVPSAK